MHLNWQLIAKHIFAGSYDVRSAHQLRIVIDIRLHAMFDGMPVCAQKQRSYRLRAETGEETKMGEVCPVWLQGKCTRIG